MKKNLIAIAIVALSGIMCAQNVAKPAKSQSSEIYSSLKPKDGQPAVFANQQDLDAKVQDKKNNIIAQIKENINDAEKVKIYRQELWRFENAIVISNK